MESKFGCEVKYILTKLKLLYNLDAYKRQLASGSLWLKFLHELVRGALGIAGSLTLPLGDPFCHASGLDKRVP